MSVEITFALRTQIRGQKMPISGPRTKERCTGQMS
jgi:hypothetical protein